MHKIGLIALLSTVNLAWLGCSADPGVPEETTVQDEGVSAARCPSSCEKYCAKANDCTLPADCENPGCGCPIRDCSCPKDCGSYCEQAGNCTLPPGCENPGCGCPIADCSCPKDCATYCAQGAACTLPADCENPGCECPICAR